MSICFELSFSTFFKKIKKFLKIFFFADFYAKNLKLTYKNAVNGKLTALICLEIYSLIKIAFILFMPAETFSCFAILNLPSAPVLSAWGPPQISFENSPIE